MKITQKRHGIRDSENGWDSIAAVLPQYDSDEFDFIVDELLVALVGSGKFERIRNRRLALFHAGDDVGAAEPVGFGQIGLRPAGGMVGVGMVEADDVFTTLAAFALDADQFAGIDVVAVMRGVSAGIAAAGGRGHDAGAIVAGTAEKDSAALVRVSFFTVAAEGLVVFSCNFQHGWNAMQK